MLGRGRDKQQREDPRCSCHLHHADLPGAGSREASHFRFTAVCGPEVGSARRLLSGGGKVSLEPEPDLEPEWKRRVQGLVGSLLPSGGKRLRSEGLARRPEEWQPPGGPLRRGNGARRAEKEAQSVPVRVSE